MEQKGTNYLQPPLELVDGEEEFEVENVLGHQYFSKGCNLQYLIKWKGYPMADNTWEPVKQVFAPHQGLGLSSSAPHGEALAA